MIKMIVNLTMEIYRKLELNKYDAFSIEEYFRKQGADVGYNNRLLINNIGDDPFMIKIGSHCTIAPEVTLLTHDGGTWVFTQEKPDLQKFGKIEILDNCFIGFRATIMPDMTIGPNSIVGACSVVTKDVPPETVVAGNPARVICPLSKYKEKVLRAWQKQKPQGYLAELNEGIVYPPRNIENLKRRDSGILKEHLKRLFLETD